MTGPDTDLPALFALGGRRALVTGGGGGLGRAIAAALAGAGADVVLLGRSDSVEAAAASIGARAERADLTDRVELGKGFERAVQALGGLDILVTCHGEVHAAPAADHPLERWDTVVESNLTSVFELCQLAGRRFLAQGRGKVITVASMLSFSGGLNVVSYAASKGGLAQMTKALANEWAPAGVNVNAIAPGYFKTSVNAHIWRDDPTRTEQILTRIPAGRWGEPGDLAGAAIFLASSASDYLHGVILPVDGGYLSR